MEASEYGIGVMFAEVSDGPLVNVDDPYEGKVQRVGVGVETNDEQCRMEVTSPDWASLSALVFTPAGNYRFTVTHDGAKLEPMTEPAARWYESAA